MIRTPLDALVAAQNQQHADRFFEEALAALSLAASKYEEAGHPEKAQNVRLLRQHALDVKQNVA